MTRERVSSIDSITNPTQDFKPVDGNVMYYHNIQFLGGGPRRSAERSDKEIEKIGERVSKCSFAMFVEVMDGSRKFASQTETQMFEQIIWNLENARTRCSGPFADIDQEISSILSGELLNKFQKLKEYLNKNLEPKLKGNGDGWKGFLEKLNEYRPKKEESKDSSSTTSKSESKDVIEKAESGKGKHVAGIKELDRISKAAGSNFKFVYRTCGSGAGEGIGMIYDTKMIRRIETGTISLASGSGVRGAVYFVMQNAEGQEFAVVGAHFPYKNMELRKECIRNFMSEIKGAKDLKGMDIVVAGDFNITAALEDLAQKSGFPKGRGLYTSMNKEHEYDRAFILPQHEESMFYIRRVTSQSDGLNISDHEGFFTVVQIGETPLKERGEAIGGHDMLRKSSGITDEDDDIEMDKEKSRYGVSNLKRFEKFQEMEGMSFVVELIQSAGIEKVDSLIRNSKKQADEDDKVLKAKLEVKKSSISLISEADHRTDHPKNIDKLIQVVKEGKIPLGMAICLERKQKGSNFGMADVILLADILKHNAQLSVDPIKLPQSVNENSLLYKDAQLYNAVRDFNATPQGEANPIIIVGIEGKGLTYSQKLITEEQIKAKKELEELQQKKADMTRIADEERHKELDKQIEQQKKKIEEIDKLAKQEPSIVGLDVNKDSILYDAARERAMAGRLEEIVNNGRNVILPVGAVHSENLVKGLRSKGIEVGVYGIESAVAFALPTVVETPDTKLQLTDGSQIGAADKQSNSALLAAAKETKKLSDHPVLGPHTKHVVDEEGFSHAIKSHVGHFSDSVHSQGHGNNSHANH